jgi:hypothetical protein
VSGNHPDKLARNYHVGVCLPMTLSRLNQGSTDMAQSSRLVRRGGISIRWRRKRPRPGRMHIAARHFGESGSVLNEQQDQGDPSVNTIALARSGPWRRRAYSGTAAHRPHAGMAVTPLGRVADGLVVVRGEADNA